ncbi:MULTISPECIES: ATP-dependent zinc metalloprotease FtsH [unclassified Granulicatella]|uniref:ATP-dependent zinc metalloprotease FtsH n=1 Tax=unclassified Granulicatella TaxID=2630493 RepID=UPI0010734395|nr:MULTISPECIES: ATP-dependent zinc metalloprotease FtsH [unclassified Granulicatella]MBF0780001.1 ATP-dependent zinc metalloprotease FtsH [Granulicatella sp. 19428wC4_WM01]TFU95928.1 ATP-dependent metallopeptidase FtsH/Yme1/Tma family protein [Granulicatella sp. WM01]
MKKKSFLGGNILYIFLFIVVIWGFYSMISGVGSEKEQPITLTELVTQLEKGNVSKLNEQSAGSGMNVSGEFKEAIDSQTPQTNLVDTLFGTKQTKVKKFNLYVIHSEHLSETLANLTQKHNVIVRQFPESDASIWITLAINLIPILIIGFFMFNAMGNMGGNGGRNPMSFGRLRPEDTQGKPSNVRFSDVAGADEEKQELIEVVEFLKDPRRFTALGAKIPKGVLLEGPPGTGKTLLAKAVAGEANVPFHSISGSQFVEMFVGVGASRVRDLFEKAKKTAPAIIFIDEIDAVGRRRGAGMGGGNDEREQTLNQLLVEMDGFESNEGGVIVIAATNRSDVLDPALLRPGRFDRKIMVGNPDVKAREDILAVHAKNKPLASDVVLKTVAQQTPGFAGADLANLLNEAALIAARLNKKQIEMEDINEAQDRIIAGLAKRDRKRTEKANRIVAYHEAGHAIAGLVLDAAEEVHKVTIVPRGRAAGYVISLPKEDQVVVSKEELFHRVVGLLAGRTAEEIIFNEPSTGALNDFEQATEIVRAMIMKYGMSSTLGMVDYGVEMVPGQGIQKVYSDQTAHAIDNEVIQIMNKAHQKAREILMANRTKLDLIAEKLLEFETIDGPTIKALFETGQMPSTL